MDPQTTPTPIAPGETSPLRGAAAPVLYRRIGLLGAGAAATVAVGMLVAAAVTAPNGIFAADSSAGDGSLTGAVADHGGRGRGGHRFGGISITAIDGNDLSLETVDGWTRTITVDAETTYSESGEEIALRDLEVGDTIHFRQTLEDDGTWTIDAIAVVLPRVGGEVIAVDGSTITVEGRDGSTATVTVDSNTTIEVNGEQAALRDIEVGMILVAEGELTGDNALAASAVKATDAANVDGFRPGRGHGPGPGFFFGPHNGDGTTPDATDDSEAGSDSAG